MKAFVFLGVLASDLRERKGMRENGQRHGAADPLSRCHLVEPQLDG
jgi:hypothetical protein